MPAKSDRVVLTQVGQRCGKGRRYSYYMERKYSITRALPSVHGEQLPANTTLTN